MYSLIIIALLAYLIGSFPTSVVMGRMTRRIDIREYGSNNAGGTNAFRVLGWQAGLIVALVDLGKGIMAAVLISKIRIDPTGISHELVQVIAGTSAIIGHIWTVLAKFQGGKGVATAAGVLIGIFPWAALISIVIFIIMVVTTRYVSLASMTAVSAVPIVLMFLEKFSHRQVSMALWCFSIIMSSLILFTHRSNIKRLFEGTENRFNKNPFRKKM